MNDQRDEEFLADFNRDALPDLPENPNLSDPVCGFFPGKMLVKMLKIGWWKVRTW